MFRVKSKEINDCIHFGKKHFKVGKGKFWTLEDAIIRFQNEKSRSNLFYRRTKKQRQFELEEYGEILEKNIGKEKVIINMSNRNLVVKDTFDKLTNSESVFFWLYNTTNYYDEKFGGYTYLDEVLCYLIAFVKKNATKYGKFKDERVKEKQKTFGDNVEELVNGTNTYDNFEFLDHTRYIYIKKRAENLLRSANIIEAQKEIVKKSLEDPDYARATLIQKVQDLAKTSNSDKVKLEAYKLLGNWFGIDKPVVQNNINVVMSGIENDLQRQGFDFDVSDFQVIDVESEESENCN